MEKTDFERVEEKLKEVGAELKGNTMVEDNETEFALDFWNVAGRSLIVWSDADGNCGLYSFVGVPGDPVERDLEFIENLVIDKFLGLKKAAFAEAARKAEHSLGNSMFGTKSDND